MGFDPKQAQRMEEKRIAEANEAAYSKLNPSKEAKTLTAHGVFTAVLSANLCTLVLAILVATFLNIGRH